MQDCPRWAAKYIGIPFREHGRDRTGVDCYGLLYLVLRDEFNIHLPSYAETYQTALDVEEISALLREEIPKTPWQEIPLAQAQPGDGLLFRIDGQPMHVGVLLTAEQFLHVDRKILTCVDRLRSPRWARRLLAVYRYTP